MAAATATLGAEVLSALIGRQILTQAISDASYNIYNSVQNIFYYSTNVDIVLQDLDISNKVKMIEEITKNINDEQHSKILEMSLESIHDMVIKIREDLKAIDTKIAIHKKKYFANWRSVSCKKQINNLILHCKILDKRFALLIQCLDIVKNQIKPEPKQASHSKRHL